MTSDMPWWVWLLVGLGVIVLLVIIFLFFLSEKKKEPSPLEVLIQNLRKSGVPTPCKAVIVSGNPAFPRARIGKPIRIVPLNQCVGVVLKPTISRAGFFGALFTREIHVTTPSAIDDTNGHDLVINGLTTVRYVYGLHWIHPDLSNAPTLKAWNQLLSELPEGKKDPRSKAIRARLHTQSAPPSEVLPMVDHFFVDVVKSLLTTQEELVALDLNSRSKRAIPFDRPEMITLTPGKPEGSRQGAEDEPQDQAVGDDRGAA